MISIQQQALDLANNAPAPDATHHYVFFSNQRNRKAAVDFCNKNPGYITVLHTEMHKALERLDLFGKDSTFSIEQAVDILAIVSARFAKHAAGNIIAFTDKVSDRSTFFTVELPILLNNENVTTINGAPKETWSHYIMPPILPRSTMVTPEMLQRVL